MRICRFCTYKTQVSKRKTTAFGLDFAKNLLAQSVPVSFPRIEREWSGNRAGTFRGCSQNVPGVFRNGTGIKRESLARVKLKLSQNKKQLLSAWKTKVL